MEYTFDIPSALREQRSIYHLTLGEMIESIKWYQEMFGAEGCLNVVVDNDIERIDKDYSTTVHGVGLYAGINDDLALFPTAYKEPFGDTLSNGDSTTILPLLESAVDSKFTNKKGEEFLVTSDTPLWVSDPVKASRLAVIDCRIDSSGLYTGAGELRFFVLEIKKLTYA